MGTVRDPLAAFDPPVLAAVAGGDEAERRLRAVARRHQEAVRATPGVDDLVYEWRRAFPRNELVERRDDAYYLLVGPAAWREFGDALGLDAGERDRLRALHARQFAAAVGDPGSGSGATGDAEPGRTDDRAPMVLTRP
ncbi:MAG: hypothetical protein ABEJ81_00185 [Haloferacaceae archaeon]